MTLKQPSQSFFPSGQPTCQSCSVAGPLQRKRWLDCRLQHKEESSSLKYLGSEFNLKGAETLPFHSYCAAVWRMAQTQCEAHFCLFHFCWIFAWFLSLEPPVLFSHLDFLEFSISVCNFHHSVSCYVFSRIMQGRGSCQHWPFGVMLWKYYGVCCHDKHRSVYFMPARVLQGLAGPGRVERGDQRGLGRQFLWENSCYHTVILHQGLASRSCVHLQEVVTACQKTMCVPVWCLFVCLCPCR